MKGVHYETLRLQVQVSSLKTLGTDTFSLEMVTNKKGVVTQDKVNVFIAKHKKQIEKLGALE